ncbi:DUF2339 domain-containing protein [Rhodovastum atsumiense]|uniref:DUF2339 domain-containing protein n=1 Tax=Rhodovastum atsumiense TaxID=504468 RepID=A0A5M6IT80_9PROT|nr:DUF2339 domain-containing protein [Rhodovastum atsumiense]KAA5611037.1 DUF2339 domain-containing protein [Rhodovastum atsumiense]
MEIILGLVVILVVIGGWLLGILGFIRAARAERGLAALRRQVEGLMTAAAPAPPQVPPQVAPWQPVAPPPPVATQPPPIPTAAPAPGSARDVEALLTQRWGTWLGAAALLLSGVFLIRYAVDNGLLGPAARCLLALLLGAGLLGGAGWLRRRAETGAAAALAAGGVAVLFGAAYGAGPFYGLLPPLVGFGLMALAAATGLLAALRFGPLVAAIGVTGAFATPALVATSSPSLPGLFAYLLLVTAAALAVMRRTAWVWLGWAATIAGALWVAVMAGEAGGMDAWAPALFVPAAAALHLGLLPAAALDHVAGRRLSWIPFAVLGVAGLLLEAVAGGAAPRVGVLLLSPLAVWKGWAEPRLDRLPWLAAGLGLLVLLLWALPDWQPTGEVISIEGVVQAILPGAWAPEVIRPLLLTAALLAAFHAAAGLLLETRAARPLPWATLAAAMPVLTLAVTYAQVARFQRDALWALAAGLLAGGLAAAAARARRQDSLQRAGVYAAGVLAALALGCAMLLRAHWLTLAIALFLPPLAWVEAKADLPPLRSLAMAIAAVVLVRLLLNPAVLSYDYGTTPLLNGLIPAYGVPAAGFALAAAMLRRRADDRSVAVLEAGAMALTAALVALEIHHLLAGGALPGRVTFLDAAWQVAALALQAALLLGWAQRPVPREAGRVLGGMALAGGGVLILANPIVTGAPAGWSALVAGYLLPAALAALLLHRPALRDVASLVGGYAVLAAGVGIGLAIRLAFHPDGALAAPPVGEGEQWAYSGAGLAYGGALLALGIRRQQRGLRRAALAIAALVTGKAFLLDMGDLAGLWRVLSFLGLGLALIALGAVYRRFVIPPASRPD